MGKSAARMGDNILQDAPHCHAPIHPPAPTPTPVPHPPLPLAMIKGEPTVLIGGMPAARVGPGSDAPALEHLLLGALRGFRPRRTEQEGPGFRGGLSRAGVVPAD